MSHTTSSSSCVARTPRADDDGLRPAPAASQLRRRGAATAPLRSGSFANDLLPRAALSAGTLAVAVASAAVLFLAGCASTGAPVERATERSPAQVGLADTASTTAVDARWWSQFGDATLDGLVAKALSDAPSLQAARARVLKAQSLADAATGRDLPAVAGDATIERQRVTEHGLYPPPYAGSVIDTGNVQVGLSWDLDLFGRQREAIRAALGGARAARAEADVAGQQLATQVARAYFQLARLGSQREVAQATLAQREKQLSLVQQRVHAGLDTVVELRQSETGVPEARASIESIDEQIALTRHQLAVLTGQAPQALDALTVTLARLTPREQPVVLGADLLGRRPDIAAARERVEAATHDVASARAQFYPDVNLSAFVGFNSIGLDKLFEFGSRQVGAGPAVHLPIFEGGQLRANLRGKSADLNAAVDAYNQQVLDAVREAADAISSSGSIARQRAEQERALASAESAYEIARERYAQGLTSYLVVLNTETSVLAQRRAAVDLRFRTLDVQAQLMKSLGGGWSATPVPATTTTQNTTTPSNTAS